MNQGERDTGSGEFVTIDPRQDGHGVTVVDRIERRHYTLTTPDPVSPREIDPEGFRFPVDTAAVVETGGFDLPNTIVLTVRDEEEEMLAQTEHFEHETFPEGTYSIELHAAIKLFLEVEGSVEVHTGTETLSIRFDGEVTVRLGARSYHERPAGTVRTTGDPEDAMRAVSTFGSALKTLSPERSFPTLRGHPPAVEVGEELEIPPGLEPPESGVRIEVPRDLGAVYTVAPLAYYLGARIRPGDRPRLVTDAGFEYDLGDEDFETRVECTLKQVFLLDCATRTEGFYRIDLHERETLEDLLDLDFPALYDASIADRTEQFLQVPFETVANSVPKWTQTAHVDPAPGSVESLPYLVQRLAAVRTADGNRVSPPAVAGTEPEAAVIEDFTRGVESDDHPLIRPVESDAVEDVWVGDGVPLGASKGTPTAFRNRHDREPTDGDIEVTVVYNDDRMREERPEEEYGSNELLPLDVTVRTDLTRKEFRRCLTEPGDFLHYVGHVDDGGFRCVDGRLDATELDEVGVDAFLLNACHSYDQGMALIDAGAVGGIVTLDAVVNSSAVRTGRRLAELLAEGFSLGTALELVGEVEPLRSQYVVVGDSRLELSSFPGGTPHVCSLERTDGKLEVVVRAFAPPVTELGSLFIPHIDGYDQYHLNSGEIGPLEVAREDLEPFLHSENIPVFLDGDLHWSEDLDLSAI